MKTKEELNQLKIEYEVISSKLKELSEDELSMVIGGFAYDPFETLKGGMKQDIETPRQEGIDIRGLETIGPYAVGSIPLDSDSKLKK